MLDAVMIANGRDYPTTLLPGMTVNADAFSSVKPPKIASGTRKNSIESLSLSFVSVTWECDE